MATALAICQEFARRTGLAVPGSLFGGDVQALQMAALLNELCDEVTTRFQWQELLRRKASWSAPGTEDQGTLASLFGSGLQNMIGLTLWNATTRVPVDGPLTTDDYQLTQVRTTSGTPFPAYKIYEGHLYITPAPAAGNTMSAMYKVNTWATSVGGTAKSAITADDDNVLFPDALVKLGLRWKWREEKGLPYAEAMRSFEMMAIDLLAKNSSPGVLSMAGGEDDYQPGIWVSTDASIK